jgi:hypothetical protein
MKTGTGQNAFKCDPHPERQAAESWATAEFKNAWVFVSTLLTRLHDKVLKLTFNNPLNCPKFVFRSFSSATLPPPNQTL